MATQIFIPCCLSARIVYHYKEMIGHSDSRQRIFWICCVFLLFFRAHWAFEPAWSSDEGLYLQHLCGWLGLALPSSFEPRLVNPVAIGAPLLWLVPGLVGRVIALLAGASPEDWILPLIALSSMVFWGVGFAYLDGALATAKSKPGAKGTLVLAGCVPVLYYCVHRAMMSHAPEFAAAMGLLCCLRRKSLPCAMGFALLLIVIRYNDAPALLLPLAAYYENRKSEAPVRVGLSIGALGVVGFSGWLAFVHGYAGFTLPNLLASYSWSGVADVLVGWNFGLLWTALPWLGSLGLGLAFLPRLSWTGRAAVVWLLAEALLIGGWIGNGSDFGYRYLIGSYAASFLIWFELFDSDALSELAKLGFRWILAGQAVFLTFLLLAFKTLPGTGMGDTTYGGRGSPIIPHLLAAPFQPKFFKVVLAQNFPPVTIFISLFMSDHPGYSFYAVHGGGLILLCLVTAGCLGWLGWTLFSDNSTC